MTPALKWFKSSYSTEQGGACIEIAESPSLIHIRDSKIPGGPRLAVTPAAWADFTAFAREQR
ncbi:DUF397 domain-containing protein [Streptomyces sp. NPDC053560]|uniref:DUF397 domain-containing protein n=1 Tax=Streptomyces sp. NPDC053560 TaxID=3365711 RepID=UPI0037CDF4D0